MVDPSGDDAAIEAFHAAARRRRRVIMVVTALACFAIGAAILIVTLTAGDGSGDTGGRYETRTLAAGGAFLVAGFGAVGMAIKGE